MNRSGAAYSLNARWASDLLVLGQVRYNNTKFEAFYLRPDELPVINTNTGLAGVNIEARPLPGLMTAASYVTAVKGDYAYYGPTGQVIGIDMTDTMLEIARKNAVVVATNLGYPASNVEFRKGMADAMPVDDNTIDLIISNCVINLAPDKRKVFREMFRVAKPGRRFTISDIVADQPVPQYLAHDAGKWGDCLSGALTLTEYMAGMTEAGFVGLHLIKSSPWQRIDGIHFFSVTLTGYKLPAETSTRPARYATLRGPFSRVVDERGTTYMRGIPQPLTPELALLLSRPPFASLFIFSEAPQWLNREDPRWTAVLPEQVPCSWKGDYALLAGPFLEAHDDDQHVFRRGEPVEICSKTLNVLATESYAPHFAILNRASQPVGGDAVNCAPTGGCC